MVTSIRAVFQEELWQSAKRIAFAAVAMICCCTAYGQQSVKGGSYYALVIGINQYRPPVPRLQTAVNDAEEVAGLLTNLYGFRVKLLTDDLATRDNILGSLDEYRRTLRSNDNLLVYYAGHGYADKEEEKAYWLPVDAERDTRSRWIIADELTTKMRADPARHVLVISDSCFSGGLLREAGIQIRPVDQQTYMTKMLAGRSRTLMSSGGNEPVTDGGDNGHSVFANAVIRALLDTNMKEFTAEDLFHNFVLRQVAGSSDQIPKYSSIRNSGDDSGDFVFSRVGDINPTNSGRPPSSPTLSSSVTNNPDLDNAGTSSAAVPHKNGKIYLINYSRQFAKIYMRPKPGHSKAGAVKVVCIRAASGKAHHSLWPVVLP